MQSAETVHECALMNGPRWGLYTHRFAVFHLLCCPLLESIRDSTGYIFYTISLSSIMTITCHADRCACTNILFRFAQLHSIDITTAACAVSIYFFLAGADTEISITDILIDKVGSEGKHHHQPHLRNNCPSPGCFLHSVGPVQECWPNPACAST